MLFLKWTVKAIKRFYTYGKCEGPFFRINDPPYLGRKGFYKFKLCIGMKGYLSLFQDINAGSRRPFKCKYGENAYA